MSLTTYLKDTRAELRHVTWPSRDQVVRSTAIVITVSLVVALFLGLFDVIFSATLRTLIGA